MDTKTRETILKRDEYICQWCGLNKIGVRAMHVHHIDLNKNNNSEKNLITLCRECHIYFHKLERWERTYQGFLNAVIPWTKKQLKQAEKILEPKLINE